MSIRCWTSAKTGVDVRFIWTFFLFGCSVNPYDRNSYENVANYTINYNTVTPEGLKVDTSGQEVDLTQIDTQFNNVVSCLTNKFPNGLPTDVIAASHCTYNNTIIDKAQLGIKIAPNWHNTPSTCGGTAGYGPMEVFPCNVPNSLCEAKGLMVTPDCPCECRSAVLDNSIVVTTPNLYLLNDALIRILTSCNDIWTSELAGCF